MSHTGLYIQALSRLKTGDLGLLRTHAGQGLDESVDGFDIFAGIWWPLRKKSERTPRREVAWLIAKLYAFSQIPHAQGDYLAHQLRLCQPNEKQARDRYQERFDRMLALPINLIEPSLRWALDCIASNNLKLDWVKLTNDLSSWERESKRLEWARQFLQFDERKSHVD
jgi:CRISPR type I-E-associated protein CasB/Cse2